MVRDDVAAIAAEVKHMAATNDVVVSSGGLGPTLDDVTMQAVAGERVKNSVQVSLRGWDTVEGWGAWGFTAGMT